MKDAKVFIIDNDESHANALVWLIESLGYPVEVMHSANTFLREYTNSHPGCLICDVRMPEIGGLELQTMLASKQIDIPIIFVTGHGDVNIAVQAMKNGAVDFMTKPINNQMLLDAVNLAIRKDIKQRGQKQKSAEFAQLLTKLTPREKEVMALMVQGKFTKNIADQLGISPNTVDVHRANIIKKMKVSNLSALISLSLRNGWQGEPDKVLL